MTKAVGDSLVGKVTNNPFARAEQERKDRDERMKQEKIAKDALKASSLKVQTQQSVVTAVTEKPKNPFAKLKEPKKIETKKKEPE